MENNKRSAPQDFGVSSKRHRAEPQTQSPLQLPRPSQLARDNGLQDLVRSLYGDECLADIIIYVGPHERPFKLHCLWLASRSTYFTEACNSIFRPGGICTLKIPDLLPGPFEAVTRWLYAHAFEIPSSRHINIDEIVETYKAAKFLGCKDMMEEICDAVGKLVFDMWKNEKGWDPVDARSLDALYRRLWEAIMEVEGEGVLPGYGELNVRMLEKVRELRIKDMEGEDEV